MINSEMHTPYAAKVRSRPSIGDNGDVCCGQGSVIVAHNLQGFEKLCCLQDACTCLKRRLQMDHPQKQYLAIILTSKVRSSCPGSGMHTCDGVLFSFMQQLLGESGRCAISSTWAA